MKAFFTRLWSFVILIRLLTPGQAADRPNILLAIADDWGWPHAMMVDEPQCKTPTFDRLCREGVRYSQAYVASPSCTPSRAAILSGQHIWRLGTGANLYGSMPQGTPLYTDLLREAGYTVGSMRKGWGPGKHPGWAHNPAGKRFKTFEQFLKQRTKDQPFCFWFGTSDPHRGYKLHAGAQSGMDLAKLKLPACFPDSPVTRGDVADYYTEVQRFDRDLGQAIQLLEDSGELENTIVIMTSDHGMPFPRAKSSLYDLGARVPLVVRWGNAVPGRRIIEDFVSTVDLAPTFLEAAGVKAPEAMTGTSFLAGLKSGKQGRIDPERTYVFTAKERHVPCQEAPNKGGTPMRAIRNNQFLYIHNLFPDRWPAGTPNHQQCIIPGGWYGDTDNGPTKFYMIEHKDRDAEHRRLYELSFAKRPEHELFDVKKDPHQLNNLAADPDYADVLKTLSEKLHTNLNRLGDPRVLGGGEAFDTYSYGGGGPKFPGR